MDSAGVWEFTEGDVDNIDTCTGRCDSDDEWSYVAVSPV